MKKIILSGLLTVVMVAQNTNSNNTNNSSSGGSSSSTGNTSSIVINNGSGGGEDGKSKGYGSAGCGLGSVLMGNAPSLIPQLFAATINQSSGQTYSMTTGTSNCDTGLVSLVVENDKYFKFLEDNIDMIALDVSKGSGEYVNTIASYYNMDSSLVSSKLQANFDVIYTNDNIQVSEIAINIHKVLNS